MSKLDYKKVFDVLVEETADYLFNNHLNCMVLGISGGIDSTVVAAICHEVRNKTGIPLIGRSLPIKNKDDEFNVSKLVGEAFCDDFKCIPLQHSYIGVLNNLLFEEAEEFVHATAVEDAEYWVENSQTPIANGNIQARLRMIYLYNLASIHEGLVMSTDNQTEYQLGFWTLHGDVGDFDPIHDLWKTEVYELAEWLKDSYFTDDKSAAIGESMKLTPTDGLGISNSDLDQIGAKSYAEVDDILDDLLLFDPIESDSDYVAFGILYQGCAEKYGREVVKNIWKRHKTSAFKRKISPMYICRSRYE